MSFVKDLFIAKVTQAMQTGGSTGGSTGPGAVVDKEYVNFYDYDGTLLYSYDAEEVAAMTELPPVARTKGAHLPRLELDA